MAAASEAEVQDLLTKNIKDLLWLNTFSGGKEISASDALAALKANGPVADGEHASNLLAILTKLASAGAAKQKEIADYGLVKYVTELSLEELMAAGLEGVLVVLDSRAGTSCGESAGTNAWCSCLLVQVGRTPRRWLSGQRVPSTLSRNPRCSASKPVTYQICRLHVQCLGH
jgi:hypothetical protein